MRSVHIPVPLVRIIARLALVSAIISGRRPGGREGFGTAQAREKRNRLVSPPPGRH
jgi:hypothetical protein